MSPVRFLIDRLPLLALYFGSSALVLLFLKLAHGFRGLNLTASDIAYMAVLQLFAASAYVAYDWLRHRPLYRQLKAADGQFDDALRIASPVTGEEEALVRRLHDLHYMYTTELLKHRREQERHLEYVRLWVHQMKTPVSVIDLQLQQPPEPGEPEKMQAWLASLREETERITDGLDTMLHAARLNRFETDLHIRKVDVVALLRQCVNERKAAFIRGGVFPRISAESEPIEVETDGKWLRFVLHQLLSNALKYSRLTGRSGLTLDLRIWREDRAVCLRVKDEGIGIPPEDLPRIFEPFFTGENGRLTKEASGMGLYLVKQTLDRLGHRLEVASRPGEGTAATIVFETRSLTELND